MTDSFARLTALPFAIILIVIFTSGGLDFSGPRTFLVLFSLICLALIYVFNDQINRWWWTRRMPALSRPLKAWIRTHSVFYKYLDEKGKELFENRVATFNHIKNFTLKIQRDFQLEEDIKTIISHEFVRITMNQKDFLFNGFDQIVVYNHPFGSPVIQKLHTIELHREDKVIILSKEQLINGFLNPDKYVNIGLLAAVMAFIAIYPRLEYPDVVTLNPEDIADAHGIRLDVIKAALGVDWINRLDLLVFCYFMHPNRTESFDPRRYEQLENVFGTSIPKG